MRSLQATSGPTSSSGVVLCFCAQDGVEHDQLLGHEIHQPDNRNVDSSSPIPAFSVVRAAGLT
jgi:hypothetical protein